MNLDPFKNTVVTCFKNPKIFLPSFFIYLLFAILLFLSRDPIFIPLGVIIGSIFLSSFYPAIIKDFLEKKKFSFYKEIFPAIKRIPKIFLLLIIIIMSPFIIIIPFFLLEDFLNNLVIFISLLIFSFIFSIYFHLRLLFAVPIFVLNKYGIFESIKKSWEFTRKRTLGVLLNYFLLNLVIALIVLPPLFLIYLYEFFYVGLLEIRSLSDSHLYFNPSLYSLFFFIGSTISSTLYMFFTTYFYLYFKGKKSKI